MTVADGRFFAEMSGSNACASDLFGRTVDPNRPVWREADMTGARPALSRRLRMMLAAISLGAAGVLASQCRPWRAARTASPTSPRR